MPRLGRKRGRHSYGRRPLPEERVEPTRPEAPAESRPEPIGKAARPPEGQAQPPDPEIAAQPDLGGPGEPELDELLGFSPGSSIPAQPAPSEPAAPEPVAHQPVAPRPAASEPAASERSVHRPGLEAPQSPPPPAPAEGPRTAALTQRKRRTRRIVALEGAGLVVVVLVALAIAAAAVALLNRDERTGEGAGETPPAIASQGSDPAITTLVYGTRDGGGAAAWVALLSYDLQRREGGVVYIPADTAAEIPGRGPQGLGEALASGGPSLLMVSAENLLDVPIDRYLELSEEDLRAVAAETGDLTVDVPSEVRVSAGENEERVLFSEGPQSLSGTPLGDLLFTVGTDGDDAELGARHLAFWDGLFERFQGDPQALAAALESAGDALHDSDASAAENAEVLQALAALPAENRRLAMLPVTQVGAGSDELFRIDRDEMSELLASIVGSEAHLDEVRVQLLNGNGAPGIGVQVARRLVGRGYRIVLSGNALSLNRDRTKIVSYDDSPEGLDAARNARELLGVGQVTVSSSEQDIVDLTIVVGRDFLRQK